MRFDRIDHDIMNMTVEEEMHLTSNVKLRIGTFVPTNRSTCIYRANERGGKSQQGEGYSESRMIIFKTLCQSS